MPADNDLDPLDRWLSQQVWPMSPPDGTFERITKRARRRKIRKAAVSVASAAAVAAAVAVAVPLGLSASLGSAPANVAAGDSTATSAGSRTALGTATRDGQAKPAGSASSSASSPAASASGTGSQDPGTSGYLPANFAPSSVTWDSLTTGWVIGQAGTPGTCADANPYICTSIARTDDGGKTWSGLPAPKTGAPQGTTGVGQLRFLNGQYGWAFGPELWATDDGGERWTPVPTGGKVVTDLETMNGRAYALWGSCSSPASGNLGDAMANCTGFTLMTTVAGSGSWTAVGGVPASLSAGTRRATASLELAGRTGSTPATGYLIGPHGNLYSGPVDGGNWSLVGPLPCAPSPGASGSGPANLLLAPAGIGPAGKTRLAVVCADPTIADTVLYLSDDAGGSWTKQANVGSAGTSLIGAPTSLTALPDGTLILATETTSSASGGIYLLPLGAARWQPAIQRDAGFTYVGMTSVLQGVALSAHPSLNEIWMTADGGQTWQPRKISG